MPVQFPKPDPNQPRQSFAEVMAQYGRENPECPQVAELRELQKHEQEYRDTFARREDDLPKLAQRAAAAMRDDQPVTREEWRVLASALLAHHRFSLRLWEVVEKLGEVLQHIRTDVGEGEEWKRGAGQDREDI